MSLETWKSEFYPIPAYSVPVEQAVQHSLRKWIGLRLENLEKHGVMQSCSIIYDDYDYMRISESSCALCVHFLDIDQDCAACPLAEFLGRPCDESSASEYASFIRLSNPEPMIEALESL